jgi:hypothetical protein
LLSTASSPILLHRLFNFMPLLESCVAAIGFLHTVVKEQPKNAISILWCQAIQIPVLINKLLLHNPGIKTTHKNLKARSKLVQTIILLGIVRLFVFKNYCTLVMNLQGTKVSLHSAMVSLHGTMVSLQDTSVGANVSLCGTMVSLFGTIVSRQGEPPVRNSEPPRRHSKPPW